MFRKLFPLFSALFLISPLNVYSAGRFDGEYTGSVTVQSNATLTNQVTTKLIDSEFTVKTEYSAANDKMPDLSGKAEITVTGKTDGNGKITGSLSGKGYGLLKGTVFAKWDITSAIDGTISEGTMKWTANAKASNYDCPKEMNCGDGKVVAQDYAFNANLTRTMTSNSDFVHQPEKDDYTQNIDQSLPIIEKVMGEVQTSDVSKKGSFLGELKNIFNSGKVDEMGKYIESARVWEDGKSGPKLKVNDEIKTGTGRVVLKFPDGTRFILMENTTLRKTADGFKVDRGGVYMDFWKIGNKVRIITKRAKFSILGTKLAILEEADKTILEVYEGNVEAEKDGKILSNTKDVSLTITDSGFEPQKKIDSVKLLDRWNNVSQKIESDGSKTDISSSPQIFIVLSFILGSLFILGIILIIKHKTLGVIFIIIPVAVISYLFATFQKNTSVPTTTTDMLETLPSPEIPSPTSLPTSTPTSQISEKNSTGSSSLQSSDMKNWITYKNKDRGFSVKHPSDLKPEVLPDGDIAITKWGPTQEKDTEFYDGLNIAFRVELMGGKSFQEAVEEKRQIAQDVYGGKITTAPVKLNNLNGLTYVESGYKYFLFPTTDNRLLIITNLTHDPGKLGFEQTAEKILSTLEIL